MLPALTFLMMGLYAIRFGLDAFIASADPSYNYLVNSYEVMTGAAPFAIHHPGTTLQYLMGVTNWISWLVAGRRDGSFADSVVSNPEWYLDIDLFVLVCIQTAALAWSSLIIARRWGLAASFGFSGGVILLIGPEYNLFLVGPVALGFAISLIAIGLAVKIISGAPSTTTSVLFGAVLVCGVMNKATFLPMLALFGVYFFVKGFRAAFIGAAITFLIFVGLIRDQIFHLGYWFIGLLSTTGRNPSDVSNVPLSEKIINSPVVLVASMPWIVGVFLIYLAALAAFLINFRKNDYRLTDNRTFVVSVIVVVVIAGSTLMTIKDYRQGDLIVVAAIAPLLLASSFCFYSLVYPKVVVNRFPLVISVLFAVLTSIYFITSQVTFVRQEVSQDYLAEIAFLESRRIQGDHVAISYGVFTPGSALGFGDDLSNHLLATEIDNVYPRQLALSLETLQIQSRGASGLFTVSCEVLAEIESNGSGLIVAPGRSVDPQGLAQANGSTSAELIRTFGEWPVFRLTGFTCPAG